MLTNIRALEVEKEEMKFMTKVLGEKKQKTSLTELTELLLLVFQNEVQYYIKKKHSIPTYHFLINYKTEDKYKTDDKVKRKSNHHIFFSFTI